MVVTNPDSQQQRTDSAVDPLVPGFELHRPSVPLCTSGPLSEAQVSQFFSEGVVVVRGLVGGALLQRVQAARSEFEDGLEAIDIHYEKLSSDIHTQSSVFHELATESPIAQAAAQLTPRYPGCRKGRELVVLRDGFFKLKGGKTGGKFHVDDQFFWPCPDGEPGPGVNVWIALDPVTPDGGGLAVVPGSHTAQSLPCRDAVKRDRRGLDQILPQENQRFEELKVVPKMEPGDAILMTRYLFHRSDPFRESSSCASGRGVSRYTVRYMPGTAWLHDVRLQASDDGYRPLFKDPCLLMDADAQLFPAVKFLS